MDLVTRQFIQVIALVTLQGVVFWLVCLMTMSIFRQNLGLLVTGGLALSLAMVQTSFLFQGGAVDWLKQDLSCQQVVAGLAGSLLGATVISSLGECMLARFMMFARLVDSARGAQFAEHYAPEMATNVSLLEKLVFLIVPVVGFKLEVHHLLFSYVWRLSSISIGMSDLWLDHLLRVSADSLVLAGILALPAIAVCMLLDISLSVSVSYMPKVNLLYEFVSVKLLVGLALGSISAYLIFL